MKKYFRFLFFWMLCFSNGFINAQGLLISEVLANPNGTDSPFEYVELIATQAIDFSVTPYSVIFSNNGNATAAGWVAGGAITYGFNITTGTVAVGDVVYVGGSSMLPTGAKLRIINTATAAGDRFGSANSGGVLGNGGNNADAVGVFNVNINAVTNTTVPIDAIFFGAGPTAGGAVVNGGIDGYQLPVNDNYTGGKLQSNSFLVTDPASDELIKATGTFNPTTNTFSNPRSWTKSTSPSATSAITLVGSAIVLTPSSLNFTTNAGNPSAPQSYVLQGTSLTADVTVTASPAFEVSFSAGAGFTSSLTVTVAAAHIGATVYVRYNPSGDGTNSGTVQHVSGSVTQSLSVQGATTGTPFTPIYTLQGNGAISPYLNTNAVTQGIVTGDFQNGDQLKGFYIQAFPGDGDPQTSDGIFVYDNSFGVNVIVGDLVRVSGRVIEFNTTTEISNVTSITILTSGNVIAPTVVNLPIAAGTTLEKYEGMYLQFTQTLTVSETYTLGRYGEVVLSADGRKFNPTNVVDPNDNPASGNNSNGASNVAAVLAQQDLNNRRSILLDDGSTLQNPPVVPYLSSIDTTLRIGSTVSNLTGVLDFAFGTYRLQPTAVPSFTYAPRPSVPAIGNANVKLASFNVLNFFNGDGLGGGFPTSRGADSPAEFLRQRTKIIQAIKQLNADAVGLMELENDGDGAHSAIADLVNGLNAVTAAGTYAYIPDPIAGNGALGNDEIKVGIIYKPATLTPAGPSRMDTSSAYTVNGFSRRPLTQAFTLGNGEKFSLIVNHMKSKGCTDATGADTDQNDGQSCYNYRRRKEANQLLHYIQTIKTLTGDSDVVSLGDYNAYEQEDPIDILRAGGLINLISDNYSFVFDGQSGSLDHVFVTPSLAAKVTGATKWHINADEPIVKDYNQEFNPAYAYNPNAYRSSDHDPVLLGLNLNVPLALTHVSLANSHGNGPFATTATISGGPLFSAKLVYTVNGISKPDISPVASGNTYTFTMPVQPGSGIIQYRIAAYGGDSAYSPSALGYHAFHFGAVKSKGYVLKTTPLIGTYLNTKIYLGGASGLHYIKGSNNEFFTITDRGPNVDANNNRNIASDPNADNAKLFALPDFVPEILRLRISGDSLELVSRLPLQRPNGTPASGLINPPGFGNSGELALIDTSGARAVPDVWGIDSEGITEGNNNDFWISEEYGASIWNVNKVNGRVIKRYAPYGNLPGKQPEDAPIDTVFKYRNPNKGLEGIAIAPDGKVYSFIQNTLLFPATDAGLKKSTRLHRFVQLDPITGSTKMFGYEHDAVPASGSGSTIKNDKLYIGDAVAINNQEFLVLEHGISGTESIAKIYKINIAGATPITQAFYPSAGNKSFEQFLNAATAQSNGVTCVTKTLFLDLIENGYDPSIEKQEGLTIINDSTIAVINDNDFGIISPNADGNVVATGLKTVLNTYTVPPHLRLNLCNPSVLTAAGATTITEGDSVALSVNAPTGNTIQWKRNGIIIPSASNATLYAKLAGDYIATVTTASCTVTSNSIHVTVENDNCATSYLTVNAGANQIVKLGYPPLECATLPTAVTGGTPPYTIQWNTGATSANIYVCPKSSAVYTATVKDAKGCTATDNVYVCVENVKCGADAVNVCWTYTYNQTAIAKLTFCTSPVIAQLLTTYFNTSSTTWNIGSCFTTSCGLALDRENQGSDFGTDQYLTAEEYGLMYGSPSVKLFPNPLNDLSFVNMEMKNVTGKTVHVTVADILGKIILTEKVEVNDHTVNTQLKFTAKLAKGAYIVRVATGTTVLTEKLIVQ